VRFPQEGEIVEDPLAAFIKTRSVNRRRYRNRRLSVEQRTALEAAAGEEFAVTWFESREQRWRMARLSGLATDIRLRTRKAYSVHKNILDWERPFSPDKVPAGSIGLDGGTLNIMQWAMKDWSRVDRMNRMPGGTALARLEMDYLPGHFSAAFFAVQWRQAPKDGDGPIQDRAPALLRAGAAWQRFWLTAAQLGLVLQPATAMLCFSIYGKDAVAFTDDLGLRRKAAALNDQLQQVPGLAPERTFFVGRIGTPRGAGVQPRSVRRPLAELLEASEQRS
jgi:hypothetical protein